MDNSNPVLILLIVFAYLAVGVGVLIWIQRDNEFRHSEAGNLLAYISVFLWPITGIAWFLTRPPEQIEDLAAKKSYQDFKNFMRERRGMDFDLLSSLEKATSPDQPLELGMEETFRDHHLEELISAEKWMEATRTANDMLRFSREQQEHARVDAYEKYLKEIKTKQLQAID